LIVEDDAKVLKALQRMLASTGYEVLTARSAAEAIGVLESVYGDVDLLLTDVVMPGDSGPQLAEQIYLRWSELPVVYMTGYGNEILERHKVAQDARLLLKPFSRDELLAAIRASARVDPIAPRIRHRMRLE
jgi:DNA-binding NtrC family response regulator